MTSSKTQEFIIRAKTIHSDKYNYDKVDYVNAHTKITITCPKHGDFKQTPNSHILSSGCHICANFIRNIKYKYTKEEFIKRAKKVHGDKYIYDKVDYVNNITKITITCPEHGDFIQVPSSHLRNHGCPKCKFKKISSFFKFTKKEFIIKSKVKHGNKYNYDKTDYVNSQTKITITCPKHGDFEQVANAHLQGQGCPRCSDSHGEKAIVSILDEYNINYIREYKIPGNNYRYDFYLVDKNIYIEYHGLQHYKFIEYFHKDINTFHEQVIRDKIKKKIVKEWNGKLIIIHYSYNNLNKIKNFITPLLIKSGYKLSK